MAEGEGVKPRSRIKDALMGLTVALLFLALLNGLAAAREWTRYGTFHRNGRPAGLYVEKPGRPQLQPGARLNGWSHKISINAIGFRGREISLQKPPGTVRFWCVGGSTTFDILVSENEAAWPAQLERMLQESTPDAKIEVINAGIPGEILEGSWKDFSRLGPTMRPDVLIVYHGFNDLRTVMNIVPKIGRVEHVMMDWAILRFLREFIRPSVDTRGWEKHTLGQPALDQLRQHFQRLIDEAHRQGVQVVMATHAYRGQPGSTGALAEEQVAEGKLQLRMPPEEVIRTVEKLNGLVKAMAQQHSLPLADVRVAVPGDERYWGDASHFTDEGATLAAQALAKTILEAGLNRPRTQGFPSSTGTPPPLR